MIFIKRVSLQTRLLIALLLHTIGVQAQPQGSPPSSKTDLFTYFVPGDAAMPYGSDLASKAVIHFNSEAYLEEGHSNALNSTAFLIRTFLNDTPDSNKVCMCMAGHSINTVYNPVTPIPGSAVPFRSDLYMDYLGMEQVNTLGQKRNKVTHFSKGPLSAGELLAYYYVPNDADIALVLVDKSEIPSLSFGELGYDFGDVWAGNTFYGIGHPLAYPQRIHDNIQVESIYTSIVKLNTTLPYAFAPGSSGGPILVKPKALGDPIIAAGLQTAIYLPRDTFSDVDGYYYQYGTRIRVSKLSLLETAIRKRCWNKRDSAAISASGSYKRSVSVGNPVTKNSFRQSWSIGTTAELANAANILLLSDPLKSLKITRLNANICNFTGFALPTIYPGENKSWQVIIAANEINASSGFIYEASGNSELNLATVVIGTPLSSTSKQLGDSIETRPTGNGNDPLFMVYPNPSPDGLFYVQTPVGKPYRIEISALDGKAVYQSNCTENPCQLRLSSLARGSYLLAVYALPRNELVYKNLIVY